MLFTVPIAGSTVTWNVCVALKLGELWGIPIMLRLALIENLRRVGARVAASTLDRDRADSWADQMMEIAEKDPKSLILVIADMARSNANFTAADRVPVELGFKTNLLGPPATVRERLRQYRAAGITTLQAKLEGASHDRLDTLAQLIDLVDETNAEADADHR